MTLDDSIAAGTVYLARISTGRVHIIATRNIRVGVAATTKVKAHLLNTRLAGWSLCGKLNGRASHKRESRPAFNESACGLCTDFFALWREATETAEAPA